jgi:sarcosine oxidase subunit alpha
MAVKFYPKGGVKMWGMPIHIRKAIVSINGTEKVESVTVCDITPDGKKVKGSEKEIKVDFVCIPVDYTRSLNWLQSSDVRSSMLRN